MSRSLVVWMPAPTAAALRAKSDWAVAVEEAAEKGLAEEEVIEEGAKEGAVPKEARGGRDRWRLKERKDEEKKAMLLSSNFSLLFFLLENRLFLQNAPPVSGTLAGFCEWRG